MNMADYYSFLLKMVANATKSERTLAQRCANTFVGYFGVPTGPNDVIRFEDGSSYIPASGTYLG